MLISSRNNLYFLRHCKTENNLKSLISGQEDISILCNEYVDISQYENKRNAILLCSPLVRCKETADIFIHTAKINPKIKIFNSLIERNMGELEGVERKKAVNEYSKYFIKNKFVYTMCPPKGESYEDFSKRAKEFVKKNLIDSLKENDVILCSHNQILKMIYFEVTGLQIEKFWYETNFENGKIYKIL